MQWIHAKTMEQLSPLDVYQLLKLRQDIFIIEQECIFYDIDNIDQKSEHLLLKDGTKVIGYSRIVPAGEIFTAPSIGRIAVHKDYRRMGLGKKIVQKSLDILAKEKSNKVIIEAQNYLREFYESLGFVKISDLYPLDGITHIKMSFHFKEE